MRLSLKLSALCAAAAMVPLIAASVAIIRRVPSETSGYPAAQLRSEARAATGLYDKRLEQLRLTAQHLATEIAFKIPGALETSSVRMLGSLQDLLGGARDELSLDFLIVADSTGRVIARHNDRPSDGESILQNPLAARTISEGPRLRTAPLAAAVVEAGPQLEKLWLDKASRVTRLDGSVLEEALMIEASAPILGARGFEGAILIGQMMNNYYLARAGNAGLQIPLVGEIKQAVFPGNDAEGGAVVALGNTIIASAVRGPSTSKPPLLGVVRDTSKSDEVLESISRNYRVAWQPINSLDGSGLGTLGVVVPLDSGGGLSAARLFMIIAVITVLAAASFGFVVGRAIAARVNSLTDAVSRMSVGELSTMVRDQNGLNGSTGSLRRDEITRLAEQLDQMRESFRQAIERIRKR